MRKPLLAVAISLAVAAPILVLDPIGLFGPSFEFEDVHMRAAIEGNWTLRFTKDDDKSTRTLKLSIRQADKTEQTGSRGAIRSAAACGSRSFVRSAAACVDNSSMPIVITVLDESKHYKARFDVSGRKFERGHLMLEFGTDYQQPMSFVSAEISPSGTVVEASTTPGYTVTLERTSAPSPAAATP